MPLADALHRIESDSGERVAFDPAAVADKHSHAVHAATSATQAVREAIRGEGLSVVANPSGKGLMVTNDLVVVAHRDEAETSLLVHQTTSSDRLGQSLRDQPRNAQVISAQLLAEQQAQTIPDALRNAGGVVVNTATVQGGTTYSVRGFSSGGVLNGLPASANSGVAAGTTQSIANVDRIEVLKGPDALLAGADNLGGTINIVTKKPSADPRLYASVETGSDGHIRGTVDANNALTSDGKLSARLIATAADDAHNYGGYRGDEDYLFAPSLRYKDNRTDVLLSVTASSQTFGLTPYVPIDPDTDAPFDYPRDRAIVSRDQYTRIGSTQIYGEATRKIGDWLTLVARAQHQKMTLDLDIYSPFAVLDGTGTLLIGNGASKQTGTSDAVDTYFRITKALGPVENTLVAGYTHLDNQTDSYSASMMGMMPYNFMTESDPPDLEAVDTKDYHLASSQDGIYASYMAKVWRLHLIAGVRHNHYRSTLTASYGDNTESGNATTPDFGAVLDLTKSLSAYASLAYGYSPTSAVDRNGNRLPDIKTRNLEAGIKLDLMRDRLFFVGSWFRLRESNLLVTDPSDPSFEMAVPGQQGTGVDLNLTGTILTGWTVQASFTHTIYKYLTPSDYGNIVQGQPRDQYSIYSAYRRTVADDVTAGFGAGVYGKSRAAVDSYGDYYVPHSLEVDLNGFLTIGRFDANIGVDNVFNRTNYGISYSSSYIPYQAPRTWRLTIGYRFR